MPNFRKQRIASRVIKSMVMGLVLAVNLLIIWRVFFSANTPKAIDTLTPNEALRAVYAVRGDEMEMWYQDQPTVTRAESNRGYFSVPEVVIIPEARQVQVVFRYNNGTIKNLARDYGLASVPNREEHLFDITLVRTRDLTPNDLSDNEDPTTLEPERFFADPEPIREQTSLYTYYRYVFENVTVEDVTAGMFIDVYYLGDIDYEKKAYGTLCIYLIEEERLEIGLTADDKKTLN